MKRIVTGVLPTLTVSTSRCINNSSKITCGGHNITTRWVDEIALSTSTLDNVERMTMKMERMAGKTGNVDLNDGPPGIDDIGVLRSVKVTCFRRSAQDLEESWKIGRPVCNVVDLQGKARRIDSNAK